MKKLTPIFLHMINAQYLFPILFLFFVSIVNAQVDCDNDTIPPTLILKNSFVLENYSGLGLQSIPAFLFDKGYYETGNIISHDDCSIKSKLLFSYSSNKDDTLKNIVEIKDISKSNMPIIKIYLFDEKGNYDIQYSIVLSSDLPNDYVSIDILNTNIHSDLFEIIEFTIVDSNKNSVYMRECDYDIYNIFDFEFCLDTLGHPLPYSIDFNFENSSYLNGIKTLDAVIVSRHLLNYRNFSFCQKISADFNGDKCVSISDYIFMIKTILGLNEMNEYNYVKAYDKDLYKWEEYFPRSIEYLPSLDMEFVLIRKGDITNDKYYDFDCDFEEEITDTFVENYLSNDTLNFEVEDLGESSGIHVLQVNYIDTFSFQGYQFSFKFDTNRVEFIKLIDSMGRDITGYGYSIVDDEVRLLFSNIIGFHHYNESFQFSIIVKEKDTFGTDINELLFFDQNPLRLEAADFECRSMPIKLSFSKNHQEYSTLEGNSYVDWDLFDLDIKDANGIKIEDYYFLTSDVTNENEPADYELIFKDYGYEKPYLIDINTSKYPYIGTIDYDDMDLLAQGIIRNDNEDSDLIELGDVNCDEKVTILDIYHIYDYIFKNNEMPCGGFYFYWKDQTDSIKKFPVEVDSLIPDLHLYLKGDLNYRNTDTIYIAYEKKEIIASDDILLNLYPQTDEKIFGIQCDLNLDTSAVELVQVVKKTNAVVNNYHKINENSLLSLAYQRTHAGDLNEIFTRLRLNFKKDIETKDILSIGNAISAHAVTYSGEILPISLIEYKPDKIVEYEVESSINVYPNPSNSTITIKGISLYDENIKIFDVIGSQIMTIPLNEKRESYTMGISELNEGIYFIKIGNKLKKFIKK